MEASEAYQTLVDPDRRAVYDRENSLRRLNFFRDVDVSAGRRGCSWG
jgi:curved DNA-binding protein CbpA